MSHPLPNLLFIMTDHQRADSIGMWQCGREVTPHLNRLASQGCRFTRAYDAAPLCVPARTALATGLCPTHNGVMYNSWDGKTGCHHPTLHQLLHQSGYHVGHVGVDHIKVEPENQKRVPFNPWITHRDHRTLMEKSGLKISGPYKSNVQELCNGSHVSSPYSNPTPGIWEGPLEDFKDMYFCRHAMEFLQKPPTQPFALFVNLWAPHPPLVVPEPYASLFNPADLVIPSNTGVLPHGEPANRRKGVPAQLATGISMEAWRKAWAAHLGLVTLADEIIGRLLQTLKKTGQDQDTAILFTSDHGEQLGQRGMYQKMEVYETAVKVPFIFQFPGIQPRTFTTPVSHLDILPTLLDLLGISHDGPLDGESLRPWLEGQAPPLDRTVYSQYSGNPGPGDVRRAVITSRYKYIHDPQADPELYDLESDPLEMTNLAGQESRRSICRELHERGHRWSAARGDPVCW